MIQNDRNVPITIYTLNASETNNKDPMKYAITALQFYTNYTAIPYPLPKLGKYSTVIIIWSFATPSRNPVL